MTTSNLTSGQKAALFTSLEAQFKAGRQMTSSERELFNTLREELAEVVLTEQGWEYLRNGNFVKQLNLDTFGERYNNCWIKVQETSKGEFFESTYHGRRIYLA